jgi:hypothetical protein
MFSNLETVWKIPLSGGARTFGKGFISVIGYRTKQLDEIRRLTDDWARAIKGRQSAFQSYLTKDLDRADTYYEVVDFASAEEAQSTAALPETQEFVARQQPLLLDSADGIHPIGHRGASDKRTYLNCDVIREFDR